MKFVKTPIDGVVVVEATPSSDERGTFTRIWCKRELSDAGLDAELAQCSLSTNTSRGTLRGMHYQSEQAPESKLVHCVRGSVFDVVIDLRRASPTFCQWHGELLSSSNGRALFVPKGCAHGFLTLEDDSHVLYHISEFFRPDTSRGVRWNDPAFKIEWPGRVDVISARDRSYDDFSI
nr:dTDP-4-dehydrorhamnose 3,5-epimerase [uncultured bacterium]